VILKFEAQKRVKQIETPAR